MKNSRKKQFTAWMVTPESGYDAQAPAIKRYIEKIEYVENQIDIDVDEEFKRDGLVSLNESLKYSVEGYRHPNQVSMRWVKNTPKGTIDGYSTSINHYKVFRDQRRNKIIFWTTLFILILVVLFGWATQ